MILSSVALIDTFYKVNILLWQATRQQNNFLFLDIFLYCFQKVIKLIDNYLKDDSDKIYVNYKRNDITLHVFTYRYGDSFAATLFVTYITQKTTTTVPVRLKRVYHTSLYVHRCTCTDL